MKEPCQGTSPRASKAPEEAGTGAGARCLFAEPLPLSQGGQRSSYFFCQQAQRSV